MVCILVQSAVFSLKKGEFLEYKRVSTVMYPYKFSFISLPSFVGMRGTPSSALNHPEFRKHSKNKFMIRVFRVRIQTGALPKLPPLAVLHPIVHLLESTQELDTGRAFKFSFIFSGNCLSAHTHRHTILF